MSGYMVELICEQSKRSVRIREETHFSVSIRGRRKVGETEIKGLGGISKEFVGSVAVCLCIDKSGSMSGKKWNDLMASAAYLIQSLDNSDYISIVVFDDNAEIVVQNKPAFDKESLVSTLSKIALGSSTNMYQGIQAALGDYYPGLDDLGLKLYRWNRKEEIFEPADCFKPMPSVGLPPGIVRRIILLTDGQPNVGKTKKEDFEEISKRARTLGIPISTVGIGNDHDANLLSMIADISGGKYYYASSSHLIGGIFGIEIGTMKEVEVQCPSLEISYPNGTKIEEAYLARPVNCELQIMNSDENSTDYLLRDIEYDEELEMLFRVKFLPELGSKRVDIRLLSRLGDELARDSLLFEIVEKPERLDERLTDRLDKEDKIIERFNNVKNIVKKLQALGNDADKFVKERGDEVIRKVEQAINYANENKVVPWMHGVKKIVDLKDEKEDPGKVSTQNTMQKLNLSKMINLNISSIRKLSNITNIGLDAQERISRALSMLSSGSSSIEILNLVQEEIKEMKGNFIDDKELEEIEKDFLSAKFAPDRYLPRLLERLKHTKSKMRSSSIPIKYMEYALGDVRSVAIGSILGRAIVAVASDWGLEILSSSGAVLARFDVGEPFVKVYAGRLNRKEIIAAVAGGELYAVFEGLPPSDKVLNYVHYAPKGKGRIPKFLEKFDDRFGLVMMLKNKAVKSLEECELFSNPFLYLPGKGLDVLSDFTKKEITNLKNYIENHDGILIIDDKDGLDNFKKTVNLLFPGRKPVELDSSHPILHGVGEVKIKPLGVFDDYGRLMALFIPESLEKEEEGAIKIFSNAIRAC